MQVSGVVTGADDGQPVPGVSVVVLGTTIGTVTDANGRYSFDNVPADASLRFSFMGMSTQNIAVAGRQVVDVVLHLDAEALDEVIVVAYGQQRREAITGAVASIRAETLEKRPVSSATAALEGLALGVQVNNSYGEPGAEASIRIRGFNSISGSNEPFYVVNGVPMGGNIGDINSADIESITVLKDASSAALYGNRAGNGVILITTKGGRIGQESVTIQANINVGVYQRGMPDYERLNAYQYMEAYWMGRRNGLVTDNSDDYPNWSDANAAANIATQQGLVYNIFNRDWDNLFDANGKLTPGTEILPGYRNDLDWWAPLERTGVRQDYSLSARGGTRNAAYFMSMGYLDEQGYTKQSGIERFTGNMRFELQATNWFRTGLILNGSHSVSDRMTGDSGSSISFINPFYSARNVAPIYPVHLHDPDTGDFILDDDGNKIFDDGERFRRPQMNSRHIVWETELNKDRDFRTTLDAIAFAEITFLNDFKFTLRGNLNNRNSQRKTYNTALIGDGRGRGRMSQTDQRWQNFLFQQLLTWNRTFEHVHNVEVLLGHENSSYNRQYTYIYKQDENLANLMELSNFTTNTTINGYQNGHRNEGYFSRIGYSYNNRYFADFALRYDGSSRFYHENRWGTFWSLGGSWIISQEAFMLPFTWLDYMRLRAAYGQAGSDYSAGEYAWMALYFLGSNGGDGALYKSQNDATDVSWEKTGSFSAAVESRLFNRANLTVEYFDKRSIDLLFNLTMPASMGMTVNGTASGTGTRPTVLKNFGTSSNRGLEIGLDVDVVRTENFRWNLGTNFTYVKTKIVTMPDEYKEDGWISGLFKRQEGSGIYDYWLYQFAGIDRSDGRSLYQLDDKSWYIDLEGYTGPGAMTGDETRTLLAEANYVVHDDVAYVYNPGSHGKRDWSGTAQTPIFGAFTTAIEYKGFQLSGVFTYAMGAKTYDYSYQSLMGIGTAPSSMHLDVLKSWTPEQAGEGIDPNGTPALNHTHSSFNNAGTSTRWQINGNYMTIKNITLSYSVPNEMLGKIGLKNLVFSVTGENLAIFTHKQCTNPQTAWTNFSDNVFVPARILSMGINLQF